MEESSTNSSTVDNLLTKTCGASTNSCSAKAVSCCSSSVVHDIRAPSADAEEASLEMENNNRMQSLCHDMVDAMRVVIADIEDVWERCESHLQSDRATWLSLTFWRVGIPKVTCRVSTPEDDSNDDGGPYLLFTIEPRITTRIFGSMPTMPVGFWDIVYPTVDCLKRVALHDYETCIRLVMEDIDSDSLSLSETSSSSILLLLSLKEYLISLHAFLVQIESWISKPLKDAEFLENIFGTQVNLSIPPSFDKSSLSNRNHKRKHEEMSGHALPLNCEECTCLPPQVLLRHPLTSISKTSITDQPLDRVVFYLTSPEDRNKMMDFVESLLHTLNEEEQEETR